jgi:hypothetical protein
MSAEYPHAGDPQPQEESLQRQIQRLINRVSAEGGSNTPDFILAHFLQEVLSAFDAAVNSREKWHGRTMGWEGPQEEI